LNSLEELHQSVENNVKSEGPLFNQVFSIELTKDAIINEPLTDLVNIAADWIADDCPDNLYINHGEHVIGGMRHIIDELKKKPKSNRALYSLISTKDINGSNDKPIPSFLTFQCQLHNDILYCTATFRALEASDFLRLNLEEIRQRLVKVIESLASINLVRLSIFSFHTYINEKQSMLQKPEIDTLTSSKISYLIKNEKSKFLRLLEEKMTPSTVLELNGFNNLQEILEDNTPEEYLENKDLILNALKDVIKAGLEYKNARKTTSVAAETKHKIEKYSSAFSELRRLL
jgi:hypothetical protein